MQNNKRKDIEHALAASDMYQILSISFRFPTEQLAIGILDGSLAEDVCAIMRESDFADNKIQSVIDTLLARDSQSGDKEELLTEMRREYTRLFTHPKQPLVPIYKTLFLYQPENETTKPSLFISPSALDAERCYKKAGLIMSAELREPADHIATEMEFMMYLYGQKAKAIQENDTEQTIRRENEIIEFQDIHLKKWAMQFFEHCSSSSESQPYRAFGEIGKMYMEKILSQ